ncbi:unnamed protein product [Staurois parvus]|uniref:Kinesin motor domain-containing protein n=1 Tax=Staurois parvus TaxID=386267 RepID=A0ABN9FDZ4_9NEOB|nr:unnamed protein product [Staurois parvus]
MIRQFLYSKFSQDVSEAPRSSVEEVGGMESTTKRDFHIGGFVPRTPLPTRVTIIVRIRPSPSGQRTCVGVTGVSDIRSRDTPFKKSSAFSTPISQYLDQPVPYSLENYPNM